MFELDRENSPIRFTHNGKQYAMTSDEIEAAYDYQQHKYQLSDAEDHLRALCFGWGRKDEHDPKAGWTTEKQDACLEDFEDYYGIPFDEALRHLEAYVMRFNCGFDQELSEDDQWEYAIKMVLCDLKRKEKPEKSK